MEILMKRKVKHKTLQNCCVTLTMVNIPLLPFLGRVRIKYNIL